MDDIVDRLKNSTPYGLSDHRLLIDAAAEIERLRAVVTRQALELLVAHSENLGLYDDE